MNARRQNTRVSFHSLQNTEILNLRKFERRGLRQSGYKTLPKGVATPIKIQTAQQKLPLNILQHLETLY